MYLINLSTEALIHLETAKAILSSALQWGTIGQIARKAGISAAYLSRLQRDDAGPPSPQIAEKIAKSVVLSPEQQSDLLENWLLAREKKKEIDKFVRQDR